MKIKAITYTIGASICNILVAIFRAATLPFALAYETIDAMANTSREAADRLMESAKGKK